MRNGPNKMIKCALDQHNCIDLRQVLRIVSQISVEQAWAIGYELAALMQRLWPAGTCAPIENLAQIYLSREGFVHEKSLLVFAKQEEEAAAAAEADGQEADEAAEDDLAKRRHRRRRPTPPTPPLTPDKLDGDEDDADESRRRRRRRTAASEQELVASLGLAIFGALDFGIPEDEERKLSLPIEYLILQTQGGQMSLCEIIEICTKRLVVQTRAHAELHYRGICKSLVSDTLELSNLLDTIYRNSILLADQHHTSYDQQKQVAASLKGVVDVDVNEEDLSEFGFPLASLRAFKINDWARLWMQVIRELRQRDMFKQMR